MNKVAVITPTIGKATLSEAIKSVSRQGMPCAHYLVCDGHDYELSVYQQVLDNLMVRNLVHVTYLPVNVGKANGQSFYGHRVYAAFPHLVNEEYVAFLDEDNSYNSDHIERCVALIERHKLHFAFGLREIIGADGSCVGIDECESLGMGPIYGHDKNGYLVDTSSYVFRRDFLIQVCHLWHWGWGGDRRFFNIIRQTNAQYGCTGQPTLRYRLDGNPNSVTAEFFAKGRAEMKNVYGDETPWFEERVKNDSHYQLY